MIVYDKLWLTMNRKGIIQYDLYTYHHINRSLIHRLKHNKNIQTDTINRLCKVLECDITVIMEYVEDKSGTHK